MPLSVRERALDAVFALLKDLPRYNGVALRTGGSSFVLDDLDELPALVLLGGGDEPYEQQVNGQLDLALMATVVAAVTAPTAEELDTEISAARAEIRKAIGDALAADETLGGAVRFVRYAGMEGPITPADSRPLAVLAVRYVVEISEAEFDPYRAAT